MERSKVTCSIQVCWRKLGPHQEGLLGPSHEVPGFLAGWVPLFLPHPWRCSSPQVTSPPRTWTSHHGAWREFGLLLQSPCSLFIRRASGWLPEDTTFSSSQILFPPCAAPFAQALLGWLLHALEMIFAMLPHWLPTFWTSFLQWSGWASLFAGEEHLRGFWVLLAACFVLCFTRFHQVLGWSSCLALSNQQACGRPFCFTGRSRPLGTRFSIGSMVLSLWSAPSSLEIPALRVTRYRLAPVDHLLVPLSPAKLPVSYPFFPILALHRFWPYRLLPPTASV